jgi:hypothetical protein
MRHTETGITIVVENLEKVFCNKKVNMSPQRLHAHPRRPDHHSRWQSRGRDAFAEWQSLTRETRNPPRQSAPLSLLEEGLLLHFNLL